MGLALARGRLRAARSSTSRSSDRKWLVSNEERAAVARSSTARDLPAACLGPVVTWRASWAAELDEGVVVCIWPTAAGSTLGRLLGAEDVGASMEASICGSPQDVRDAIVEHARAEAPNEAAGSCSRATEQAGATQPAARRRLAVSLRARVDPELWFAETRLELAVCTRPLVAGAARAPDWRTSACGRPSLSDPRSNGRSAAFRIAKDARSRSSRSLG